jgi:excisionase family DNA binding protein
MELLKLSEAAKQLNSSEITIRRLIYKKQIPFRQIGRRYMFTPGDLEEYLENVRHIPPKKEVVNENPR